MTPHCCAELHCVDSIEAKSLSDMLNVLNVKVSDGYGAEFRKEAGETRLERIDHALGRITKHDPNNPECDTCKNVGLWSELEDIDGRLQEIARAIVPCDLRQVCADCRGIAEEERK